MNGGNILARAWAHYVEHVIPKGAGPVQIAETQKAFYAGALVVIEVVKRIGEDDVSEAAGMEILTALDIEGKAFVAAMATQATAES